MCGLFGIISRSPHEPIFEAMKKRLTRRGPDGSGQWRVSSGDWKTSLGHVRLALIDEAGGSQPMLSADRQSCLLFNGEIFNFQDLKEKLADSVTFRSSSDTEVLLHHWRAKGESGLSDLNGMFAFAVWNKEDGSLVLARDRAGIKPLYYATLPDHGLIFASELSALLEHPLISKWCNRSALYQYLFTDSVPSPNSILEGVRKLPPGTYCVWKDGKLGPAQPYWKLEDLPFTTSISENRVAEELESILRRSIRRQLTADSTPGCFLSGGLDSSLVAALASQELKDSLQTFSLGFHQAPYSEMKYAGIVAKHLGTSHNEIIFPENELPGIAQEALDTLDEPLADPSFIPTYFLSKIAAQKVKLVLGGDGADELFAGYDWHKAYSLFSFYGALPGVMRAKLGGLAEAFFPTEPKNFSLGWKARRFFCRSIGNLPRSHALWLANLSKDEFKTFVGKTGAETLWADLERLYPGSQFHGMNRILAADFLNYLPGSVLTKLDRASMNNGLEIRPPFLDSECIQFAFSLPPKLKFHYGKGKLPLRAIAAKYLPGEIIKRKKQGFGPPLAHWLRNLLQSEVSSALACSPLWEKNLLNSDFARTRWTDFLAGNDEYARFFWSILVLHRWLSRNQISL